MTLIVLNVQLEAAIQSCSLSVPKQKVKSLKKTCEYLEFIFSKIVGCRSVILLTMKSFLGIFKEVC